MKFQTKGWTWERPFSGVQEAKTLKRRKDSEKKEINWTVASGGCGCSQGSRKLISITITNWNVFLRFPSYTGSDVRTWRENLVGTVSRRAHVNSQEKADVHERQTTRAQFKGDNTGNRVKTTPAIPKSIPIVLCQHPRPARRGMCLRTFLKSIDPYRSTFRPKRCQAALKLLTSRKNYPTNGSVACGPCRATLHGKKWMLKGNLCFLCFMRAFACVCWSFNS